VNSDTTKTTEEQQEALKAQKAALEGLVVDNTDLEKLENELAAFNIFEAIGMTRQEIRHSAFLAFLLNPSGNHGLGDWFLKSFLKQAVAKASGQEKLVSPIDIDIVDLSQCEVRTEWSNIDILVHDPVNKIVAAIENKIFAPESPKQLEGYRKIVDKEFKTAKDKESKTDEGYKHIFVFLTPDGRPPKNENDEEHWISVDYNLVLKLLDQVVGRESTLSEAVGTTIKHYTIMVRRHIMTDSDIAELCEKMWKQHAKAMKLMVEHRPDLQAKLRDYAKKLVQEDGNKLELMASEKRFIRFIPTSLKGRFPNNTNNKHHASNYVLWFSFCNDNASFGIKLVLGPGEKEVREVIHKYAVDNPNPLFGKFPKSLGSSKSNQIFKVNWLKKADYVDPDYDGMIKKINSGWQEFREEELDKIVSALLELDVSDSTS
jgi:hypothetical protein